MNNLTKLSAIAAACALLSVPGLAQRGGGGGGGGGNGKLISYINSLPLETIDAHELEDLIHMRQEEKLARDVYLVMGATWGIQVFDNIAKSEQSHMDLVLLILNRYGIPDPLTSDAIGVYPDPAFTRLFRDLVTYGKRSSTRALWVGAMIEDLDIFDLDQALVNTDNRDMGTVWQNLSRGSRNHMRSFYGSLANRGILYRAIWLPQWRVLDIVNSPPEHEPVDENGVVLP